MERTKDSIIKSYLENFNQKSSGRVRELERHHLNRLEDFKRNPVATQYKIFASGECYSVRGYKIETSKHYIFECGVATTIFNKCDVDRVMEVR